MLISATLVSTYEAVRATRAEKKMAAERNAKDQARKEADVVARFLVGVFQSPDPTRDGREIKVVELLDKAVKRLEIELAAQPAQRAALQATLGRTYRSLGLYPQAVALAEKVHAYQLSAAGPADPKSIEARHRLASSYLTARRKPEALETAKDVLALSRQVFGPEAPDTIAAMGLLTQAFLINEGVVGEGRQLAEETLALSRKVHGPEHPETLKANTTLAKIVGASSLLEDVALQQAGLENSREVRGAEHPSTLAAMGNLADSYSRADCREEANQLFEERLALSRKVLEPGHPKMLAALGGLASGYVKAGRQTEAIPLCEELLTSSRKVYGPNHPDTLKAMDRLSTTYDSVHRRAEALQLREEVLATRRSVLGPTHPETLKSINDRADSAADLLMSEGRRVEALNLLVETSVQYPEVSQLAPKVAALQAWFGQEADFNRTRLRMLTWAAGTNDDAVANRVAKLACLRPMTDARQAETVLALARHAVSLGGGKYQLTLGMAEYRSGHDEEADAMLAALVSEQSTEPGLSEIMRHTVRFYRVMTLVHRGQLEAARALFDATELEMRPLPADELNPLADVAGHDHNHLILWLAYEEAQALLTPPAAPKKERPPVTLTRQPD